MSTVNEKDAAAVTAAKFREMYENGGKFQTKQLDVYDLMPAGIPIETCEIIDRYREKYGASKEQARGLVNTSLRSLSKKGKVRSVDRGLWLRT